MTFLLLLFTQQTVDLVGAKLSVSEALTSIHKQTNVRATLEPARPGVTVALDLHSATAWAALDAIARQIDATLERDRAGIRIIPRRAAVDLPPTSYSGPFRVRVTRLDSGRDLVANSATTTVSLEVTWLPTLRPIFIDSTPHSLTVLNRVGKSVTVREETATLVPVEDRFAFPIDLPLPAFPRSDPHIGKLAGKLNAVVLGDMLTYDFETNLELLQVALPRGARSRLTRAGVTCGVSVVSLGRERWTVRLALDYPAGANRDFESFQAGSMVVANELRLVGSDGKRMLAPSASVTEETGPRRTVISYHFTDGPTGKRGSPSEWKVRYRAPARIIDLPLSFAFDKVPLP